MKLVYCILKKGYQLFFKKVVAITPYPWSNSQNPKFEDNPIPDPNSNPIPDPNSTPNANTNPNPYPEPLILP